MNEDKITKVCTKLMKARSLFHSVQVKKTGQNEFAKYFYFELSDFLPQALAAFSEFGLVGIVSFTPELATLLIVDTESGERLAITSPLSEATLRGCHPVQNLGAVQTYQRRYLWAAAMELIEQDPVDSSQPKDGAQSAPLPTRPQKTLPRPPQRQETASGEFEWRGYLTEVKKFDGPPKGKPGKPYTVYFIKMTLSQSGEEREAGTFDEQLATEAQFWPVEDEVIMRVKPGRVAGKFEFLGLKLIEPELELVEPE